MGAARLDEAWWATNPEAQPRKQYPGAVRKAVYIPMSDGVKVAADVYLPAGLAPDGRVPTILTITPYFRSLEFRHPALLKLAAKLSMVGAAEFANEIAKYGFASAVVDMRGAAASYGQKLSVMFPDVVSDGAEVLDWIVAQSWSNGAVGATGISGPGMTAMWLTTAKHPALKAIVPRFTVFDIYAATRPGGLRVSRFLQDMSKLLDAMDNNRMSGLGATPFTRFLLRLLVRGVTPVDEDHDRRMLAAAVADHQKNEHFDADIAAVEFRDDVLPGSSRGGTLDTQSPCEHAADMAAAEVPYYAWSGWHDGAFVNEMTSLFATVTVPGRRLVIGPWSHGGRWFSSAAHTARTQRRTPTRFDHVAEMARFFALHLRDGEDAGIAAQAPVHYFTMGEERWKTATDWPPPGTQSVDLFLGPGGTLGPTGPARSGRADYAVDFAAGTGVHSRFGKHLSGGRYPVSYPKRAQRDRKLLCFDGVVLDEPVEITGHTELVLYVSSTATDGAVLAYLEDVAPDGVVTTVTDGGLRLTFAEPAGEPAYVTWGPYRACRRADARELPPGRPLELRLALYPVSWLFGTGHRIRLAIAGADRDNFVAVAEDQRPTLTVHHGPDHPSRLVLPVMDPSGSVPA